MWTGSVPLSQLRSRDCWKVEFFCLDFPSTPEFGVDLVALRELVHERREVINPQSCPNERFYYIGLKNVQPLTGDLIAPRRVSGREIRSPSKLFRPGDILYGRLRPYLNKVYLAEGQINEGICSGEFYVLTPRSAKVLPHLLRALLSSSHVQGFVRSWQTGTALPRLQLKDLLSIKVPVPPVPLQPHFEDFLVSATIRRRQLAAELDALPGETMTTLLAALKAGEAPTPAAAEG